ncbi:hypothetical protein [Ruegeria lacuscaerulensis]|uniref:hypothetical protein n=1 Tax=Ruegeria lacuscaerulensis TaxID=55218 RepID=UPI0014809A31|nr:hypothetical protein [Ruegeria lacuscaerulensis]
MPWEFMESNEKFLCNIGDSKVKPQNSRLNIRYHHNMLLQQPTTRRYIHIPEHFPEFPSIPKKLSNQAGIQGNRHLGNRFSGRIDGDESQAFHKIRWANNASPMNSHALLGQ